MKGATRRTKLLLALAATAVVAGLLIALLSGGSHHAHKRAQAEATTPPGELALAARYLGITRADLRRRLRGATLAEVADATPGRSVAGLEQAILGAHRRQWQQQALSSSEQVGRAKKLRKRLREDLARRRRASTDLAFAASYLGLPEAQVQARVLSGHSLAQVAESTPGKSRAGLIAAIVAKRTQQFERGLAARKLTAKEEKTAVAQLKRRIPRLVDRVLARR